MFDMWSARLKLWADLELCAPMDGSRIICRTNVRVCCAAAVLNFHLHLLSRLSGGSVRWTLRSASQAPAERVPKQIAALDRNCNYILALPQTAPKLGASPEHSKFRHRARTMSVSNYCSLSAKRILSQRSS